MFAVGGICLVAYGIFEVKWAKFPSSPKRLLLNKTFMTVRLAGASATTHRCS